MSEEDETDDGDRAVELTYRTSRLVPRDDLFGKTARWLGQHPVVGGIIGGLAAVAFAALSAPGGVAAAPTDAMILSGIVITVWAVLFYFMRNFFKRQGQEERSDLQELRADPDGFVWKTNDDLQIEFESPTYVLRRPSDVQDVELDPKSQDKPARVWLTVAEAADGDELFVLETQVTAGEAAEYAIAEEAREPDQTLPVHLASGLLQLADRRAD